VWFADNVSIEVPVERLAEALADFPWGYLLTVSDGGQVRLLAVPTEFREGRIYVDAGDRARSNARARPAVTMVFPPPSGTELSLVVDGHATIDGGTVRIDPQHAVLHRPALATDGPQQRRSSPK
jgi:hypothetical protein